MRRRFWGILILLSFLLNSYGSKIISTHIYFKEKIIPSLSIELSVCEDINLTSVSCSVPRAIISIINESEDSQYWKSIFKKKQLPVKKLPSIVKAIQKKKSKIFNVPFEQYQGNTSQYPIGIFDSGIGGLTVLEAILKIDRYDNFTHHLGSDGIPDFANEHFIYLGDQANMPYGNYPSEGKTDFLRELIVKDAVFLLGNRYWPSPDSQLPCYNKPPIKALVIACNTATAYGLEDLKEALRIWNIPMFIIGVVNAGVDGALNLIGDRNKGGGIAVMATVGTCNSNAYLNAIKKNVSKYNFPKPPVIQQGCVGLAGAIEGESTFIISSQKDESQNYRGPSVYNAAALIDTTILSAYQFSQEGLLGISTDPTTWKLNSVENYIKYHTVSLVEKYRRYDSDKSINRVILGCTHFPIYQDQIKASFQRLRNFTLENGIKPYHSLIGDSLFFIDPAIITADQLYQALDERKLLLQGKCNSLTRTNEFYISVPNNTLDEIYLNSKGEFIYDYKYRRKIGQHSKEYVKRVPLKLDILPPSSKKSIQGRMPTVWESLVEFNKYSKRFINE